MNNNTNTQQTTFWNFLKQHKIEIPIIQRDYAQGRIGKEKLRETFLKDLKKALEEKGSSLKLDFVYGSVENNALNPLDGQQRLTTLWLLHWYIAYKAGKLEESKDVFKNFTYETRISSREFCSKLSEFTKPTGDKRIVEHIQNQTWFLSAWKQDPTVQAMLHMLGGTSIKNKEGKEIIDGIEEVFEGCNQEKYIEYWTTLTEYKCPIIFYYLDLYGIGLTDDLYIKMNARGKSLTSFENFKADLVGYIKDSGWEKEKEIRDTIAHKLDSDWTEIFWDYRSPEYKIDEIYFTFINRFLLNSIITAKKSTDYKYTQENIEQIPLFNHIQSGAYKNYNNFDIYLDNDIFSDATKRMEVVLDNFYDFIKHTPKECIKSLFSPSWDDDSSFCFIPEYIEDENQKYNISSITQPQRVVFYAICCYFETGKYEEISLKRWIRVVWNVVENGNITTTQAMIGAMRLIDELAIYSHSLYGSLANTSIQTKSGFAKEQMDEEKEKAGVIIRDEKFTNESERENWEKKIIEAETSAFFKGTIRFLYRTDDDKDANWDMFDMRFANVKNYFDKNGVKDNIDTDGHRTKYKTDALLLKAFVSRIDDPWRYLWWNKYFFDNKRDTWKNILTNHSFRHIMNIILSGDISVADIETVDWHQKLYKTNLLSYISTNMEGSRVRDIHGHKAIYPPRYPGIILDMDVRDNILFELMNDNTIEIDDWQIVAGMPFFRGWDINFKWNKYDDYKFQWNTDRNIYILNNRNERIMKDNQHLSFPESEMSKDGYIDGFENLIQEMI